MPLRISVCHAFWSPRYTLIAARKVSSIASPLYSLELEARSLHRPRIELLDRVVESAGGAHHRHGPVTQAVNLVQAAGS